MNLQLDDFEKEIYHGQHGQGAATAMKILVAIGESFKAGRMVKISRAHVALSNQEADLWFAEKMLHGGARCLVPPTVNPGFSLEHFRNYRGMEPEDLATMERTHKVYKELGALLTYDCTPYLGSNIPRFGEIVAFSESSATPYVNSVWGARSNRESAQSALCAAITGVTPEYGMLLPENRRGNVLVKVEADMSHDFSYHLLGFSAKKIGPGIPVFVGLPHDITPESLTNLGAQLNTAGAYSMFHIVGVTPEAPSLEAAFGGGKPAREVVITEKDLQEIKDMLITIKGPIDFVLLGCPVLTLTQVRAIAELLEGKQVKVETFILTNTLNKEVAKKVGYYDIIQAAGAHLVDETCMDQPPFWRNMKGKLGVTDSPKCAFYSRRRGIEYTVLRLSDCVEAAVRGEI